MKIFYIYHSGFAVETEKYKLIFDYYMEPKKDSGEFRVKEFIVGEKEVFVFSSHSHRDHFRKEILEWQKINSNIKYILSDDIKEEVDAYFVKEGDKLEVDGVEVKVFGSTDLGVSFFVKCDGKTFFHAGDLNWWAWFDDTLEEETYMRELYYSKMDYIEEVLKEECIDYLFYPVDPRLEKNSFLGIEYFIEKVKVKNIVPMHMWDNYEIIKELKKRVAKNIIEFEKNCEKILEIC